MILNKSYEISELNVLEVLNFENKQYKANIRTYKEMKDLFYYKDTVYDENLILYYVFRNLSNEEIEDALKEEDLRIDLTVMKDIVIMEEYNKTHGHYHPEASPGRSFPELYQILKGKVMFVLQKSYNNVIDELLLIEAKEGETVIIPPNYGHNMINLNNDLSITLNLVSSRFIPIYSKYDTLKGASVYILKENKIAINKNYILNTQPKFMKTKLENENIFNDLIKDRRKFRFLNWPYDIMNYFEFLEETFINMQFL